MKTITHRQRLETCLSGEKPDHTPVSLWRHFQVDDQHPGRLAAAIVNFQQTYDFDLVKVTPASSYCIKGWGSKDEWRGGVEGTREYTQRVIQNPEDWTRLEQLNPAKGSLGQQLECLSLLVKELGPETPIIQTIFSPLSQAKNLVGKEELFVHLRRNPDEVHAGLKIIAETTQRYIEACLKTGVDGIFYAIQHAQYGLLSESEFDEFCTAYDLPVLEIAKGGWLNMLHVHGQDVMFDKVVDFPVQIINWHDRETEPSLAEAKKRYDGVLCGGLRRNESVLLGTPEDIQAEALDAIRATDGTRFILGTGCVTMTVSPHGNLLAARQSVEL